MSDHIKSNKVFIITGITLIGALLSFGYHDISADIEKIDKNAKERIEKVDGKAEKNEEKIIGLCEDVSALLVMMKNSREDDKENKKMIKDLHNKVEKLLP